MSERAVVLCRTAAGVRAAGWLARQGVAVRLLCTASIPVDSGPLVMSGNQEDVEALYGPCSDVSPRFGMWVGGRLHGAAVRKRDLLAAVDPSALGLLAYGFGRLGSTGPSAADWTRSHLGAAVWDDAVHGWLEQRLAGPSARCPAGVVKRLLGRSCHGGWWLPRFDGATRRDMTVTAILEAAGEALEHVAVEGIDVEHGRVVGLHTEFGFEHLDGVLYTDFSPGELAALLPGDTLLAPHPPLADRVLVEVRGQIDAWAVRVLDSSRRLVDLRRSSAGTDGWPRPDRVWAEAVVAPADPLHTASDEVAGAAIRERLVGLVSDLGPVLSVVREPARVACPRPSSEAPWPALVSAYQALGIQPLGETGMLLPMLRRDELTILQLASAGAVVKTQRDALLEAGPIDEPWSLMVEA